VTTTQRCGSEGSEAERAQLENFIITNENRQLNDCRARIAPQSWLDFKLTIAKAG
jgi:hypothetical protein